MRELSFVYCLLHETLQNVKRRVSVGTLKIALPQHRRRPSAVRFMAFCRVKGRLSACVWPCFGLVMAVILLCVCRHLALCLPSSCLVFAVILPCDGRRLPFLSPLQLHMLTAFSINSLCSRCLCLHTFPGLIFVRCAIILRQRPSLHSLGIIV